MRRRPPRLVTIEPVATRRSSARIHGSRARRTRCSCVDALLDPRRGSGDRSARPRARVRSRIDGHDLARKRRGESGGSGLHQRCRAAGERAKMWRERSRAIRESFSAGGEADVAVSMLKPRRASLAGIPGRVIGPALSGQDATMDTERRGTTWSTGDAPRIASRGTHDPPAASALGPDPGAGVATTIAKLARWMPHVHIRSHPFRPDGRALECRAVTNAAISRESASAPFDTRLEEVHVFQHRRELTRSGSRPSLARRLTRSTSRFARCSPTISTSRVTRTVSRRISPSVKRGAGRAALASSPTCGGAGDPCTCGSIASRGWCGRPPGCS